MKRGKFYWADGRVDTQNVYEIDPKSTVIRITGPDNRHHAFVATTNIEDGCDVFREHLPQISRRTTP